MDLRRFIFFILVCNVALERHQLLADGGEALMSGLSNGRCRFGFETESLGVQNQHGFLLNTDETFFCKL